MAESLVSQTVIAFSTAVETSYGVIDTTNDTAAEYTTQVTRVREQPVPESEKLDDRGVIGRGNAMYPSYQRSGFRVPTAFEISDVVQVGTLQKQLRRFMGATAGAPSTVEAAIAFKHTLNEQNPDTDGLQLPSSTYVYSNNEYDYLLPGGVGSTLQFSQQGTADPTFSLGILTSGQGKRISIAYPAFGSLAVPAVDPYMYGPSSAAQYTNAVPVTVNLTTPSHKLRGLTFNVNNALITEDTRMGMPQVDTTEPKRGWYRDFLHFGDREVSLEFTMGLDGDFSMKDAEELNTVFTNFTWTMYGDLIPTTATSNKYSLAIIIPKFNVRLPRVGEDNQKRTKTFTLFPLVHGGGYGVYKIEIVNGLSTAQN